LNDISDFNTRKDVAQQPMAVAPGRAIRGLHDMLADLNGDFAAAKKQAIKASRGPSMHPSNRYVNPQHPHAPMIITDFA
jgi:hypothetical protein